MLRPDVLLAGETAVSTRQEAGDDDLLATQVARLNRKIDSVAAERRRLADLYQANFIEQDELLRRGKELELRRSALEARTDRPTRATGATEHAAGPSRRLRQHSQDHHRPTGFRPAPKTP